MLKCSLSYKNVESQFITNNNLITISILITLIVIFGVIVFEQCNTAYKYYYNIQSVY